jgi:hypothetical protein
MIARMLLDEMSKQISDRTELDLMADIETFVQSCKSRGGYMPACATVLRLIADELADRFPDDTNGGRRSALTSSEEPGTGDTSK